MHLLNSSRALVTDIPITTTWWIESSDIFFLLYGHCALVIVICSVATQARERKNNVLQDEKNQILTTNCWLTYIWVDHHLKWNTSDFAGIQVVRIPYHRVWRPDVILYNK
jgi:Neurotransmitter-gated ion-channel ligand binding domain